MTEENLRRHADHPWAHTWADLKPVFDSFERTRVPPKVVLCGARYQVADGLPGETGGDDRRLPQLRPVSRDSEGGDLAIVTSDDGTWSPPGCVIEDEERRRAAHTLTSASTTAVEPQAGSADEDDEAGGRDTSAGTAVSAQQATMASEPPVRPRKSAAGTRSLRRNGGGTGANDATAAPTAAQGAGGADGFGSAVVGRSKERVGPVAGGG
jgi:hypothetical protein